MTDKTLHRKKKVNPLARAVEDARKSNVCWKVIEDLTGLTRQRLNQIMKSTSKTQKP